MSQQQIAFFSSSSVDSDESSSTDSGDSGAPKSAGDRRFDFYECFFGDLTADLAADRLKVQGDFLLRCSPDASQFFVALYCQDLPNKPDQLFVQNPVQQIPAKVCFDAGQVSYTFDSKNYQPTFRKLVAHHYTHRIPLLDGTNDVMSNPVKVPKYRRSEDDVQIVGTFRPKGKYHSIYKVNLKSDSDPQKFYVMKVLNENTKEEKFMEEIHIMKFICHFTVTEFFGMVVPATSGPPVKFQYLLEYAPFGKMTATLENQPKEIIFYIGANILCAIDYLHSRQILHRALCMKKILAKSDPSNNNHIFPVISDFSASCFEETAKKVDYKWDAEKYGEPRLPLNWMAPENVNDKIWTKASDVWNCGTILWTLFSKKEPYYDVAQSDLSKYGPATVLFATARLYLHGSGHISDGNLNKRPSDMSDGLWSLVTDCWKKESAERLDMRAVLNRCSEIFQQMPAPATAPDLVLTNNLLHPVV